MSFHCSRQSHIGVETSLYMSPWTLGNQSRFQVSPNSLVCSRSDLGLAAI